MGNTRSMQRRLGRRGGFTVQWCGVFQGVSGFGSLGFRVCIRVQALGVWECRVRVWGLGLVRVSGFGGLGLRGLGV